MPSAKLAAYAAPSAERGLSREVLARQYGINRTAWTESGGPNEMSRSTALRWSRAGWKWNPVLRCQFAAGGPWVSI